MDLTIDIPNLIVFAISLVVFSLVMIDVIRTRVKIRKLNAENTQLHVDQLIYMSKLAEMVSERDNKSIEQTEGFLKFVSDSRDWAFQYIEDVQQALMVYDVALNTKDAKIINDAYKKLIDFLPEDN